jgi:hypothetical protein
MLKKLFILSLFIGSGIYSIDIVNAMEKTKQAGLFLATTFIGFRTLSALTLMVHEGGHATAAKLCKLPITAISIGEPSYPEITFKALKLYPVSLLSGKLGGYVDHAYSKSRAKEFFIAVSGPLAGYAVIYFVNKELIPFINSKKKSIEPITAALTLSTSRILFNELMNLVPWKGALADLDGGQMLKCIPSKYATAYKIAAYSCLLTMAETSCKQICTNTRPMIQKILDDK